jgi:DNA-binding transcriptional MerR regulator
VSLTIGELAQRLRVTTRALRHYDQLGLLVPEQIDPRTGYRSYGAAQLARGMQIEQLKSTGLSLASIKTVLDTAGSGTDALRQRRAEIEQRVVDHTRQMAAIDALLASPTELATPELVEVPAVHVVVARTSSTSAGLARTIRHEIQQLGRSIRQRDGVRCRSFSARFPLQVDQRTIPVEVAGHIDAPIDRSTVQPAETQCRVVLVGNMSLLPLAYDVVLTTVYERGMKPCGSVVEHYLDLAAARTEVAIPVLV